MNSPYLPELGLSLLTIPKNGGTTLWMWIYFLRTGNEEGGNICNQTWLCDGPVQAETLMVRRDPVARFVSEYRNFREKRGLKMEFGEFVEKLPEMIPRDGDLRHHFAPQSDYYPDTPLDQVDHLFDFEQFDEVRNFLEQRSGKPLPRYHAQMSRYDDFTITDAHIERIQQYYVKDYLAGFGRVIDDLDAAGTDAELSARRHG